MAREAIFGATAQTNIPIDPESSSNAFSFDEGCVLDYKARYKRFGDIVRDTVTGETIPIRRLDREIKRELGIR